MRPNVPTKSSWQTLNKRSNACINGGDADAVVRNHGNFGFEKPARRGIGLAGKAQRIEVQRSIIALFSNGGVRL